MGNLVRKWMPENISAQGGGIDTLIVVLHWFMLALFVMWGIYFVYCLIRFRQRPGHKASYEPVKAKPAKAAEVFVVVFEAFLLIGLAIPLWGAVKITMPPEEDSVVVRCVAEQFVWNFQYAGPDGIFGKTAPQYLDPVTNLVGLDPNDPNGEDDIVIAGQLHIPKGKPVIVRLSSKDVIHSFSIPVLRVKQDVIPGMEIPIWFEATKPGEYDIACAQLCGIGHYRMKGTVIIYDTQEEFEAKLEELGQEEEITDFADDF